MRERRNEREKERQKGRESKVGKTGLDLRQSELVAKIFLCFVIVVAKKYERMRDRLRDNFANVQKRVF